MFLVHNFHLRNLSIRLYISLLSLVHKLPILGKWIYSHPIFWKAPYLTGGNQQDFSTPDRKSSLVPSLTAYLAASGAVRAPRVRIPYYSYNHREFLFASCFISALPVPHPPKAAYGRNVIHFLLCLRFPIHTWTPPLHPFVQFSAVQRINTCGIVNNRPNISLKILSMIWYIYIH